MIATVAAVDAAAERLSTAARDRRPCAPVRDLIGTSDVAAAYRVQQLVRADREAAGARAVGRKIGLTSRAVQRQLGVDSPDFGVLFDDMACASGEIVRMTRLLQPRIEAEVAFVLGADLDDKGADTACVRDAVAHVLPALEIVDSRIAGWDITLADTVADNASSGLFVLGPRALTLAEVEPASVQMTMSGDGEAVSTGSGAACLGDPLDALAWLARTAAELGDPLRAGEIVLSGALGPMVAVRPGMRVHADLGALGTVSVAFSEAS